MIYITILSIVLGIFYARLIYFIDKRWQTEEPSYYDADSIISAVTIIIIVRNEEVHIERCLRSILDNPKNLIHQIIVVDDHSDDRTPDIVIDLNEPKIRLLRLANFELLSSYKNKYKKAGLHYALSQCRTEWSISTDGDCTVTNRWLESMIGLVNDYNYEVVTGPIMLTGESSFIEQFQVIEMLGTMAGTNAGITSKRYYSANAANMLYKTRDYLEYIDSTSNSFASGDDMFFIQKRSQTGGKIGFALTPGSIVTTPSLLTWKDLFNQRLRWATKTTSYTDRKLIGLFGGIFIIHLAILTLLIIAVVTSSMILGFLGIFLLVIKVISDWVLLKKVATFFDVNIGPYSFVFQVVAHCMYIVMMSLGGLLLTKYYWKGRRVR